jgi:small conductance mechanosensitive channel
VSEVSDSTELNEILAHKFESSYTSVVDKLDSWADAVIYNLPNLVVAILVFTLVYFSSGVVKKSVYKVLKHKVKQESLRSLIATVSSILVITIGLLIALEVLNLNTVLKSMLAGAGVAGLAIGLALQSSLSNTFSGIYLSLRDIVNIGDWVETNGYQGTVEDVNLRHTLLKEPDNNLVVIPNKLIVENPFKNYGLTHQIRVITKCGVGYDSDLEEVETITKNAIEEHFHRDEEKEIEFHYLEFGSSSIDFQVRFWINSEAKINILEARSKAIKVIKKAFDDHQIEIPFPIRTVYLNQ